MLEHFIGPLLLAIIGIAFKNAFDFEASLYIIFYILLYGKLWAAIADKATKFGLVDNIKMLLLIFENAIFLQAVWCYTSYKRLGTAFRFHFAVTLLLTPLAFLALKQTFLARQSLKDYRTLFKW